MRNYFATLDRDTLLPDFSDYAHVEHVTLWTDVQGFARWSNTFTAA